MALCGGPCWVILITGMPRSGTTFVYKIFDQFGQSMNPKAWCREYEPTVTSPWGTDESEAISMAMNSGVNGRNLVSLFNILGLVWKNQMDGELVYKAPQAVFFPKEIMSAFSTVIVCRRDIKGWIESARSVGGVMTHIRKIDDRAWLVPHRQKIVKAKDRLEALGFVWRSATDHLIRELDNREVGKGFTLDFGDKENFVCVMHGVGLSKDKASNVWGKLFMGLEARLSKLRIS